MLSNKPTYSEGSNRLCQQLGPAAYGVFSGENYTGSTEIQNMKVWALSAVQKYLLSVIILSHMLLLTVAKLINA